MSPWHERFDRLDAALWSALRPSVERLSDWTGADPITLGRAAGLAGLAAVEVIDLDWIARARTPGGVVALAVLALWWGSAYRFHDRSLRRLYAVRGNLEAGLITLDDLRATLRVVRSRRQDLLWTGAVAALALVPPVRLAGFPFAGCFAAICVSGHWATVFTGPGRPIRERIKERLARLSWRPALAPAPAA